MQIIFVNRYFFPDYSATSQMLSELAFSLAESGEKITIVTSRMRYNEPTAQLSSYEQINNVEIYRVYTSRFGRTNLAGRGVDYFTFYIFAVLKLLFIVGRGNILVAKTDPPLISIAALPVVWLKRAKLINWHQDIYPEVITALGMASRIATPLIYILKLLRNLSLHYAQINIVPGELMAAHLRLQKIANEKIAVIPNWSDGASVYPIAHQENSLRGEWQLGDTFVVGYSGNFGRAHDFTALIDAATALLSSSSSGRTPDILFLFIGDGAQREQVEAVVKKCELTNVQFKPYQPQKRLAESLSAIDVHIVSLKPELEGLIVPSKFYGIAAAGRPTLYIGDHRGEISLLLDKKGCGITVAPNNIEGLVEQISLLANDRQLCQSMGENARSVFDQCFDKKISVDKWSKFLKSLNNPRYNP